MEFSLDHTLSSINLKLSKEVRGYSTEEVYDLDIMNDGAFIFYITNLSLAENASSSQNCRF